jgi:hypothetical protein
VLNELDPDLFLRHSEIPDTMHIRLDFLRDFKNCLNLLSSQMYSEFINELDADSQYMDIAKFATREFHQDIMLDNPRKNEKIISFLQDTVSSQTS